MGDRRCMVATLGSRLTLRTRTALALLAAMALIAAACGGSSTPSTGGDTRGDASASECGLDALANASKPVEVTFWHAMSRANVEWLEKTTAAFNRSQGDVRVKLVQFPNYQDLLTKYLAGLSTKDLPDLFQPEDTTVQRLVDSQSVVPVQACVTADSYSLETFLPRATAYFSVGDVLYGMPWALSNPVLWYNRTAFEKAGLDPDDPPTTYDEVEQYARKIVDIKAAKHGIALRVEPYIFEFLNAKAGSTLVNNGNGRDARTTAATIDSPTARDIWTWWRDMVNSGLALDTGGAVGNIDHMLAIGTGDAAMTMEASGVLGTVKQVLESGQYAGVKIGTGPLPSFDGSGGVPVGDGSLWLTKAVPSERRAAAWQFVKYLASAEQQAALSLAGGYIPIRTDATENPALQAEWKAEPEYRTAYDQLFTGPVNAATVGSLIGDYQGVRDAIRNGLVTMLAGNGTVDAGIRRAQQEADEAIGAYNERIGAS
jgi:sn-glycerol 3-phosphate transport system substrate-binding protein